MGKIIIHSGDYAEIGNINCQVLGDLTFTQKQMSDIGKNLRNHEEDCHYFTNDENIFNGLRISYIKKNITDLLFVHHYNGKIEQPEISDKGKVSHWPEGFFDQVIDDLANIFSN